MHASSRRAAGLTAVVTLLAVGAVTAAVPAGAAPEHGGRFAHAGDHSAARRAEGIRPVQRTGVRRAAVTPSGPLRQVRAAAVAADAPAPPETVPTLTVTGTGGALGLRASTTAPYVLLRAGDGPVDGQTTPTPVPATDGAATGTWTSWGHPNGAQSFSAADCSGPDAASCNTATGTASADVDNAAPAVTAPVAGARVTGGFTVRADAPAGSAVQFSVDGAATAVDTSAPFSFAYTGSALREGAHTVTVTGCSADGRTCQGPASSITLVSDSLHPRITGLAPGAISPNNDHRQDSTTLSYTLPDTESASVTVTSPTGATVRTAALGTHSGKRTWVWNGRTGANRTVADGRYKVTLDTSATRGGVLVRGQVWAYVTVDVHAPRLTGVAYGTSVYPVKDGYRDSVAAAFRTDETTWATLTVRDPKGRTYRVIGVKHVAGAMSVSWNGRDAHDHWAPAGRYTIALSWHDAADNRAHAAAHPVTVSLRRLVGKVKTIEVNGDSFYAAGGSDPSCAEARTDLSDYTHGVWLHNACGTDEVQVATALYHLSVPAAVSYDSFLVDAGGKSYSPPAGLLCGFGKAGGSSGYTFGHVYGVSSADEGYWRAAYVAGAGLVSATHVVNLALSVVPVQAGAQADFDVAVVRVRVSYKVLS